MGVEKELSFKLVTFLCVAAAVTVTASLPQGVRNVTLDRVSDVVCPGGGYICPGAATCCPNRAGSWSCCPHPWATCCGDGIHCCPHGYWCVGGYCQLRKPTTKRLP